MFKNRLLGSILASVVVAAFAAGAAALPDGTRLASALDAVKREGFAAADAAAPRVAEPKASPASGAPSVTITSFVYAGNNTRVAELCGRVTGSELAVVRVSVDPREKKPATYNALAGSDGAFCAVVVTYTGLAEASVKGMDKPFAAAAAASSAR